MAPRMNIATSPSIWIATTFATTLAFWTCFGACVDAPLPPGPPQAKIVAAWDPLACGEPHRVAVELEDDAGAPLSASAPCSIGGLTIDAPHFGVYRGRIYAWQLGEPERSSVDVHLVVDEPIVRWDVATPR
jgi:hypothetical protein